MDTRRLLRKFLLTFGLLLIAGSSLAAFLWFIWLAPLRHVNSGEWRATHSHEAYWEEMQKKILRIGWGHDDSFTVGVCGGKEWVAWIMSRIRRGRAIGGCGQGHKDSALRLLTNQDIGHKADDWLDWWQRNKHKARQQWVLDGFAQGGLALQWPLSRYDQLALLEAMGTEKEQPRGWRHNAWWLLRDSKFDPKSISPADLQAEGGGSILKGLVRFAQWSALPKLDPDGLLRPEGPRRADRLPSPNIYRQVTTVGSGVLFAALFLVGIYCLAVYTRTRPPRPPPPAAKSPTT